MRGKVKRKENREQSDVDDTGEGERFSKRHQEEKEGEKNSS